MNKYWYYTYQAANYSGSGTCITNDGEFNIAEVIKTVAEYHNLKDRTSIQITNWKEISSSQYEKLRNYLSYKD